MPVTERQIPFSAGMVRACLREIDPKTQTRRVVKDEWQGLPLHEPAYKADALKKCPYGRPGDRLWVREAWRCPASLDAMDAAGIAEAAAAAGWDNPWAPLKYEADGALSNAQQWREFGSHPGEAIPGRYRHARFMPRWASRMVLDVVDVRVERLQEITDADALAEGVERCDSNIEAARPHLCNGSMHVDRYARLWDSLNAARGYGWAKNPWVWVVEFKRV